MKISAYSCLVALFWFDLAVIVCGCLRMSRRFSYQFGLWPLAAALAAAGLRLAFPVELPMTVVVHSSTVLPAVRDALRHTLPLGNRLSLSAAGLLLVCWGVGACAGLAGLAVRLRADYRELRRFPSIPDSRVESLLAEVTGDPSRRYRLIISPELAAPSVGGLFVPFFALPQYITGFSDDEVRYILRHEWRHFLHHDAWTKLMIEIVIRMFWWNLPVYLLRRDLDQFLEVNCDLSIIKECSREEQTAYLETVLKSIRHPKSGASSAVISSCLFELNSSFNIKQRFQLINSYDKRRNRLVIGGYGVLLALVWFASLLIIVQPESYPPGTEILEEADIFAAGVDDVDGIETGEMYLKRTDDGRYILYVNDEPWFYCSEEEFSSGTFSQIPVIN